MKRKIIFSLFFIIGILLILNLNVSKAATSGDYEYNELEDGTVEITGYTGTDTILNIPSTLNGKKVSKIGDDAFYKNNIITKVTIPNNVTELGISSFSQCKSLQEVILSDTVQKIGHSAFTYDTKLSNIKLGKNLKVIGSSCFTGIRVLTNIEIPDTVEEILSFAFQNTGIESIKLPKNLKKLDQGVFSQCNYLKEITIGEGNNNFVIEDGVIYNKDKTKLIYYMQSKTNTSFTMPNTVTEIEGEAFRESKNLKNITLSSKLERINSWAFRESGITAIKFPSTISSLGTFIFSDATSLETIEISGTIQGITYGMCEGCTSLKNVIFTNCNDLYSFSDYAFRRCTSLVSIKLPESTDLIGKYCFGDCTNLTTVEINDSIEWLEYDWNNNCPKLTNYKIPEGLVKLANGDYRRLVTITISNPNNYYSYGDAFEVLDLLNQYRTQNGLSKLTMDTELLENAMLRAQEISVVFSHSRPGGTDFETVVTSKASYLGENIAAGSSTAEGVMNQWKNSPDHNSNMLGSKYKSVGIGCYKIGGVYYWVQIFSSNTGKEATRTNKTINKTVKQDIVYGYYDNVGITRYKSQSTGEEITAFETEDILEGKIGDIWVPEQAWIENIEWKGRINYFLPSDAKWTSSNAKILKVNNEGKIELVGTGTANITMTLGDVTRTYKIQVNLPFKDVKTTDWFYSSVEYVYNRGIILGTSDTTFNPRTKLTRGMLVTILHRMEGKPTPTTQNKFKDVYKALYYYDAIRWATEKGIVHGYDDESGNFGPDDEVTRQDLAVILRNYAQYKGKNVNVTTNLSNFSDSNLISDYAKTAMQWAVAKGVINGNDTTSGKKTLTPHANSQRAEAAGMIYNYCTKVKDEK